MSPPALAVPALLRPKLVCLPDNPHLCPPCHPGKSPETPILLSNICPLPLSHVPGCSGLSWCSGTTQGSWQLCGSLPGPQRPEPTPGHGNVPGAAPAALTAPASAAPVNGPAATPTNPGEPEPALPGPRGTAPGVPVSLCTGRRGPPSRDPRTEAGRIRPTRLSPCGRSVPVVARGRTGLVRGLPVLPAMDEQRPSRRPHELLRDPPPRLEPVPVPVPVPQGSSSARRPPPVRPRRSRVLPGRVSPPLTVARADRVPGE